MLRLQVPATPDPYDEEASEGHRQAVLDVLPERPGDERPVAAAPQPDDAPDAVDAHDDRDTAEVPVAVEAVPTGQLAKAKAALAEG